MLFNRDFAPQEGLVKNIEKPYRDEICLNGQWQFNPVENSEDPKDPTLPSERDWDTTPIKIPSPWNVNGFSRGGGGDFRAYPTYPEKWNNIKSGWLKKVITVPHEWEKCRTILHFEAVAGYTQIFINKKKIGDHSDSFLPFFFDITDHVKPGEQIEILLWVIHSSFLDEPGKYGFKKYVAGSFWGSFIAGIWQDVYLQKVPELHITDTFVKPFVSRDKLEIEVTIKNNSGIEKELLLDGSIHPWINKVENSNTTTPEINWDLADSVLSLDNKKQTIPGNSEKTFIIETEVKDRLKLWSPQNPNLYGLVMSIDGVDKKYTRFGWREFLIKGKKILLNGEHIQIKGDSWHFTGVQQMSRRYVYGWYKMLADCNANGVRLHAQVYPRFYLEMADEMGMCVLDETGIWFSDSGPKLDSEEYWDAARFQVEGLIKRDRNYPSVFGWSVCNETIEVVRMVFHAPRSILQKNVKEINSWVKIARELDGTRDWISGDGEILAKTDLPTVITHYTGGFENTLFSNLGKPWGVGETGRGYYGTPKQVSKFNGDRSYESQLGRMEGLAAEAFQIIKTQRNQKASYASVFNLAWYSIKPLGLGLKDPSRLPELTDGIFFNEYKEGKPGYQPERLGPYSSTFNPGYVPQRPLYETWPLFDAVKEAFSDDYKSKKNIWKVKKNNRVKIDKSSKKSEVVMLSADSKSVVKKHLERFALRFEDFNHTKKQLILIDGKNPPSLKSIEVTKLRSSMESGSTVLFWNTDEKSKKLIEFLSKKNIEFYNRDATSYLIKEGHAIVRNQRHKDFYFSEISSDPVSTKSIGGEWVKDSSLILEACNTDWQKWNYQGEEVKTGKVYRSELEEKNPGNVIVRESIGEGELIVSTLNTFKLGHLEAGKIKNIVKSLGGKLKGHTAHIPKALNRRNILRNVLLNESIESDSTTVKANLKGKFRISGRGDKTLSFWFFSSRSLTDLLIEPGIPVLSMEINSVSRLKVSVNDTAIDPTGYDGELTTYLGFPLEKGWNFICLELPDSDINRDFKLTFKCTKRKFLREIKTLVDREV
ncbi:MAG: hypothetical protein OCD02_07390 [Spirochaetaceae bacterium]